MGISGDRSGCDLSDDDFVNRDDVRFVHPDKLLGRQFVFNGFHTHARDHEFG
jgi:hypothetical protein